MKYPFETISACCPLCSRSGCAIWKGYYSRFLFCPEMEFIGKVAIRRALCRYTKRKFAMFPSFIIPYHRISSLSLRRLCENYLDSKNTRQTIDDLIEGLPDQFYVSMATLYSYLHLVLRALRVNSKTLQLKPDHLMSLLELQGLPREKMIRLFEEHLAWNAAGEIILFPP